MSELTVDRLRENLESLKMKNTLEILDNYLERAVADKLNIVEVLDYIFSKEAISPGYHQQITVFPALADACHIDHSFWVSDAKHTVSCAQ